MEINFFVHQPLWLVDFKIDQPFKIFLPATFLFLTDNVRLHVEINTRSTILNQFI